MHVLCIYYTAEWFEPYLVTISNLFYLQHVGDFNYPRLADFGAAISGANKFQSQEVLEELDVSYFCLPHRDNYKFVFCSSLLSNARNVFISMVVFVPSG